MTHTYTSQLITASHGLKQEVTLSPSVRMASRVDALLRGLLKLLLDVSSDSALSDVVRQKLMSEAALCIKLLDGCCHGNLQVSSGLPDPFARSAVLWSCDSDQGCNDIKVSRYDNTSVSSPRYNIYCYV